MVVAKAKDHSQEKSTSKEKSGEEGRMSLRKIEVHIKTIEFQRESRIIQMSALDSQEEISEEHKKECEKHKEESCSQSNRIFRVVKRGES